MVRRPTVCTRVDVELGRRRPLRLRRQHAKLHSWTEPEATVVLGRPEQDDQGDVLRVRGAEKCVHQGAPDPFCLVGGKDADRTHSHHSIETHLRSTCSHMTDNRALDQRSERQLMDHVLRLPECSEKSNLGWHPTAVILALERFCVDKFRGFVVAPLLWSDDHERMVACGRGVFRSLTAGANLSAWTT